MNKPDLSYKPPEGVLEWAEENQMTDTLAKAYCGICVAIGSIEYDAVTDSELLSSKEAYDDESMDDYIFSIADELRDCDDTLYLMRNRLAELIDALLKS